jgi:hypothetical protein
LGIASLEDKVVQRAVVEVMGAIYEADFLGFSYGFRPGRSQHDALDALTVGITRKRVNWVLDLDIRGFFDHMDHEWTVKFVELRRRMHEPLAQTGEWLQSVVRGYFQYHAVPGNTVSLSLFRERLARLWRHVIRRRSQKRRLNWDRLQRRFDRWLPRPCILHPFPHPRFDARHPRWEPLVAPVRICAGGAGQPAFLPRLKDGSDGGCPRFSYLTSDSYTLMLLDGKVILHGGCGNVGLCAKQAAEGHEVVDAHVVGLQLVSASSSNVAGTNSV